MTQELDFVISLSVIFVTLNLCTQLTDRCYLWNYKKWAFGK